MSYLTIVRHGQTTSNVAKVCQSRTGGELTPLGLEMAKSLGRHLKDEEFTRVFSSDLHRCKQTTEAIVSELEVRPSAIEYTPILRERDYGDWEFVSYETERKKRLEMNLPNHKMHQVDIPNGETYEECKKRAGRFFSVTEFMSKVFPYMREKEMGKLKIRRGMLNWWYLEICKVIDTAPENKPENILAVSHGTYIACLIDYVMRTHAAFTLKDFDEEALKAYVLNTCRTRLAISRLQPGENRKRVISFTHVHDAEHLETLKAYYT